MDFATVDATIQELIARSDFVGGIDNEELDFAQLAEFINSGDGSPDRHTRPTSYFADSLQTDNTVSSTNTQTPSTTAIPTPDIGRGKLVNVIIDKRQGHHLPESPPDSGSEHPYSPAETTDPQQLAPDITLPNTIYTTLTRVTNPTHSPSGIFKHHLVSNNNAQIKGEILSPLLNGDHIMLGNHNSNHHQMIIGNSGNRCLEASQGCVLVQAPDSQTHHILQRDPNMIDLNRSEYNLSEFKLPIGHDLESVIMQSAVSPRPRRDGSIPDNRGDYNRMNLNHDLDSVMIPQSPIGPRVTMGAPMAHSQMDSNLENMQAVYTNLQNVSKKRKMSQDVPLVKSEPEMSPDCISRPTVCSPMDPAEEYSLDVSVNASTESNGGGGNGNLYVDGSYQCIQFKEFLESSWHTLADHQKNILPMPFYKVDADKGFNFSNADDAFVCQKKNHFQITCQIQLRGDAKYVQVTENRYEEIASFHLHFYGVKYESPDQEIKVEQSQSDRSKKPFYPVFVDLSTDRITKVTVGRLHFSETTSNNMRKKGKPNPEQRYFQLVVGLYAHVSQDPKVKPYPISLLASNRIIVRASNPGQFESDIEPCWQKGSTNESIYHAGKVGINTDRPDESLVIHGNLKLTGHIVQPSDLRAKQNIKECNTAEQLETVKNLRLVRYEYEPEFAFFSNIKADHGDIGVIAQEVAKVLPEAVSASESIILPNGKSIDNLLVVNKERIFMESVGAVKELCKVTNNLENRIVQLETMNERLSQFRRGDSVKSSLSTVTGKGYNYVSGKHHSRTNHIKRPSKYSKQQDQEELFSNKAIQITIIILVVIMACCLAAITTLYYMNIQHHSNRYYEKISKNFKQLQTLSPFTESPFAITVRDTLGTMNVGYVSNVNNVKPTKPFQKTSTWIKDNVMPNIENDNKEDDLRTKSPPIFSTESTNSLAQNIIIMRPPLAIGRPSFCTSDTDLEGSTCPVYCCTSDLIDTNSAESMDPSLTDDDKPQITERKPNATEYELNKDKLTKPIILNNINKEVRKRREADIYHPDWGDIYSDTDTSEHYFSVVIQGRHFNVTLNADYCYECNSAMNLSYNVPISKYMPDELIYINFQNTHSNIKELEFCLNTLQQSECGHQNYWNDQTGHSKNKDSYFGTQIVERNSFRTQGRRFEIDMISVFRKVLTYRAPLINNNQNVCDLPASKLGINYLEYNFNFYRDCED